MDVAVFLTEISSADASAGCLSLAGKGVVVSRADARLLIERYHLTPFSIDADAAVEVTLFGKPIRRVVICHGSLEEPTVFGMWLDDRVLWTSRGWVSGDSLAQRTRLFNSLVSLRSQRGRLTVELNALCRLESITLDDVLRLSGLS
jgi:hypothetical protein